MSQRPLLPATWKNLYYPPEKGYTYFIDRERYPSPALHSPARYSIQIWNYAARSDPGAPLT